MGLFDAFKKKEKTNKTVKEAEEEISAPGWDAITEAFDAVYPGQDPVKHYGTLIKWRLGGKDPLDGISVYDGGDFWHFVTYGLSELYEKETEDPKWSGYGYEMTLKLKKGGYEDEEAEIRNICGILQMIARLTFTKNEVFLPDEFIYTGQTAGIDAKQESKLTGFITIQDPTVAPIDTPNGRVEFTELIGMTDAELKTLSDIASVQAIYAKLGSDITDLGRTSII